MGRLLFWLPLLFWLAVEIYLLQVALSVNCLFQPGGNRHEVFQILALWGFPSSMLAFFLADAFWISECSTGGCVAVWLLCCAAGFIQWYFALKGLAWIATKIYRRVY
jgi:hypothetical protein